MSEKVILILVDGMRPDALAHCSNPYIETLKGESKSTLHATTIFPSMTLPCHMSLFHSVPAERHGVTTNTFSPMVRPLNGLCEQLSLAGKDCTFFYNWSELRDLCKPASLSFGYMISEDKYDLHYTNEMVTKQALSYIEENKPDFAFVYLGMTDIVGHRIGWMTEEYFTSIDQSFAEIEQIVKAFGEEYTIVLTADHGGHGRSHGEDIPEDMTIPLFIRGKEFAAGKTFEKASILDIAPTIVKLMGAQPDKEWEGTSLL